VRGSRCKKFYCSLRVLLFNYISDAILADLEALHPRFCRCIVAVGAQSASALLHQGSPRCRRETTDATVAGGRVSAARRDGGRRSPARPMRVGRRNRQVHRGGGGSTTHGHWAT